MIDNYSRPTPKSSAPLSAIVYLIGEHLTILPVAESDGDYERILRALKTFLLNEAHGDG